MQCCDRTELITLSIYFISNFMTNFLIVVMHLSMSLPPPPPPPTCYSGELTVAGKFYIEKRIIIKWSNARLSPGGGGVGSDIDRCISF